MRNVIFGIIVVLSMRCVYDIINKAHMRENLHQCEKNQKALYIKGFQDGQTNCFDANGSGEFYF